MKLWHASVGGQWFRSWLSELYRSGDRLSYDTPVWEVSGSGPGFHRDIGVLIYEAMTPLCGRSVVQALVVRGI